MNGHDCTIFCVFVSIVFMLLCKGLRFAIRILPSSHFSAATAEIYSSFCLSSFPVGNFSFRPRGQVYSLRCICSIISGFVLCHDLIFARNLLLGLLVARGTQDSSC